MLDYRRVEVLPRCHWPFHTNTKAPFRVPSASVTSDVPCHPVLTNQNLLEVSPKEKGRHWSRPPQNIKNHNLNYIWLELNHEKSRRMFTMNLWGLEVGWQQTEGQIGWLVIIISFEMRFVMFDEYRLLRDKFPGTSWYRKYMVVSS